MISSHVYLCMIPQRYWDTGALSQLPEFQAAQFANEALMAERRIAKKVNLENERRRYSLLCHRLETEVLKSGLLEVVGSLDEFSSILSSNKLPAMILSHVYLESLRATIDEESPARLGATFFPPSEVPSHVEVFEEFCNQKDLGNVPIFQLRSQVFRWAVEAKCGIIELQHHFAFVDSLEVESLDFVHSLRTRQLAYEASKTASSNSVLVSKEDLHEVEAFKSTYKQRQVQTLSSAILKAIKDKEPANFSNRSNDVITEVLHRLVYILPHQTTTPFNLRVVYADGSEGRPFPIRCLNPKDQRDVAEIERLPVLRAVLMSMRHIDLDRNVDMAWFRNREVSKMRTLAETDEYCYETTLNLLGSALREGPLRLHMYHTGFEPAVIGFYRALVVKLKANQSVSVTPYYYRGRDVFELGTSWR